MSQEFLCGTGNMCGSGVYTSRIVCVPISRLSQDVSLSKLESVFVSEFIWLLKVHAWLGLYVCQNLLFNMLQRLCDSEILFVVNS